LSRARNDGALHSDSDIVAYIDDDAIPDPNWLTALAAEFADPNVMAVAGYIEPISESEATSGSGGKLRKVDRNTPRWFAITTFGGIGDGGNMAFRRSAFRLWPGFDERFGLGAILSSGEEHNAFFSLVALGGRCVYTPHAVVRHLPDSPECVARNYEAAIAHSLVLFKEQPRWSFELLKHLLRHAFMRKRDWRVHRSLNPLPSLSADAKFAAALAACRTYLRLIKTRRRNTPLLAEETPGQ
jgi:cellulose synthase/poly-beta-1,6-N-acetylglucosamine synthase-like glycosyltransferase